MKILTFLLLLISIELTKSYSIPLTLRTLSVPELAAIQRKHKANGRFLMNNYKYEYFTTNIVSIGIFKQNFILSVETGQTQLWVFNQTFSYLQPGQHTYDPTLSGKSKYVGPFEGWSGPMTMTGNTYNDGIMFFTDFTFMSQDLGVVSEINSIYKDKTYPLDGCLGVGWNGPFDLKTSPLINLFRTFHVNRRVASVFLDSHRLPINRTQDGRFNLGVDEKNCEPVVNYVNLQYSYKSVTFNVDSFSTGKYSFLDTQRTVMDTGYPVVMFSPQIFEKVNKIIQPDYDDNVGLYVTDCSRVDEIPAWIFVIGGNAYPVRAFQFIIDLELGNGKCVVTFGETEDQFDQPDLILGTPFIREWCNIYDIDNMKVGFAKSIPLPS